MTLDPAFVLTSRLYEQRASAMRQRIGRRLCQAEAQQAWLQAAEQARQEIAEQQQVDMLGAAVDAAYAPLMQCEQAHEAAAMDALEDLRRSAKELTEDFSAANDATLMSMADQYADWRDWQWSIGDLGL